MTPPECMRAEMRDIVQNSGAVTAEGLVSSYSEDKARAEQNDKSRSMNDLEPSRGR